MSGTINENKEVEKNQENEEVENTDFLPSAKKLMSWLITILFISEGLFITFACTLKKNVYVYSIKIYF